MVLSTASSRFYTAHVISSRFLAEAHARTTLDNRSQVNVRKLNVRVVRCLVAILAWSALAPAPIEAEDARSTIREAYKRFDSGWTRHDAADFVALNASSFQTTYKNGTTSRQGKEAQLAEAHFLVRAVPNEQNRQISRVTFLNVTSNTARVQLTFIREVLLINRAGTSSYVRMTSVTDDSWARRAGTWHREASRVVSEDQVSAAQPSPPILQAIAKCG